MLLYYISQSHFDIHLENILSVSGGSRINAGERGRGAIKKRNFIFLFESKNRKQKKPNQ